MTGYLLNATQYLRPRGEPRAITRVLYGTQAEKAKRLDDAGLSLEMEELTTLQISMTYGDGTGDIAIRIGNNDPSLDTTFNNLLDDAIKWLDKREETT